MATLELYDLMLEIEAKFEIPSEDLFQNLLALRKAGPFSLRPPSEILMVDRYYDTPQFSLRALGYGLRMRQWGEKTVLTLKHIGALEGDVHLREETECTLSSPEPDPCKWPANAASERVREWIEIENLNEVCRLEQRRIRRLVFKGRFAPLEMSLDRIHATAGGKEVSFLELELEIRSKGSQQCLADLLTHLSDYQLAPAKTNKLERALRLLASPTTTSGSPKKTRTKHPLGPDTPFRDAVLEIVRINLKRTLRKVKGTRAGKDVEELHQMRTSVRRLRVAMELFAQHLPPKPCRKLADSLKALGRALGPVRDYDVLLEKLGRYRKDHPEEFRENDPLRILAASWEAKRARARKAMIDFLDGGEYELFQKRAKKLLRVKTRSDRQKNKRPPLIRVCDALPALLWRGYGNLLRYGPGLEEASMETYHGLRIECKRLRYLLEFFEKTLGPQVKEWIAVTKETQDHLGEVQDATVTNDLLDAFLEALDDPRFDKAEGAATRRAVRLLEKRNKLRQQSYLKAFPAFWDRLGGNDFRSGLNRLIEKLTD